MNDRLAATVAPASAPRRPVRALPAARLPSGALCPSAAQRRDDLRRLRELLRHQDVLAEARAWDCPRTGRIQDALDILGSTLEINHALRHLGRWMPRRPLLNCCS